MNPKLLTAEELILGKKENKKFDIFNRKKIYQAFINSNYFKELDTKNSDNIKEDIRIVLLQFLSSKDGYNCMIDDIYEFCDYILLCLELEDKI